MIPKELLKKIRRLEIRSKGLVEEVFGGEYHAAFKGQGVEFAEVRPYQVGDDVRTIDWNVSARTGEAHVKIFEEEREQTLLLAVDVSASGDFGSRGEMKRELAAEVCAVAAFSALRNGDKVGLLLFSDRVELFVPPKKGRRHALRLLRELYATEPEGQGTDLRVALDRILHVQKRRAIVLLVSDFLTDSEEAYARTLRAVGQRHDAVAVWLEDPREDDLPPMGLVELTDAETGETVVLDTRTKGARRAFKEAAARRRALTQRTLRRARVDAVTLSTGEDWTAPLAAFFHRRNRRR